MHAFNGRYARAFNWRHGFSGHVFEKRFAAAAAESHVLAPAGTLPLHRAEPRSTGSVSIPASGRGAAIAPAWALPEPEPFLDIKGLLALFGRDPASARRAFQSFVENGIEAARAA